MQRSVGALLPSAPRGVRPGGAQGPTRHTLRVTAQGWGNGTVTKEEAARYTPEQLEFLRRKREASVGAEPSYEHIVPQARTPSLSPEQQAFLERKRREASASPAATGPSRGRSRSPLRPSSLQPSPPPRPAAGNNTGTYGGPAGLTPEQAEFLERKRREASASPVSSAPTRGRSRSPARRPPPAASTGSNASMGSSARQRGLSPEQQAFLERKQRETGASPVAPAPSRGRSRSPLRPTSRQPAPPPRSSSSRNNDSYGSTAAPSSPSMAGLTPEQQEFMERKLRGASASPVPPASSAPAPANLSPEQLAFLERKRSVSATPRAPPPSRGRSRSPAPVRRSSRQPSAPARRDDLSMASSSLSSDGLRPMEDLLASLEATIQACVADGLVTQDEAKRLSPEQLEFLVRKRTGQPQAQPSGGRDGRSSSAPSGGGSSGGNRWTGLALASLGVLGAGFLLAPDLLPKGALRALPSALRPTELSAPAPPQADSVKLADPPAPPAPAQPAPKAEDKNNKPQAVDKKDADKKEAPKEDRKPQAGAAAKQEDKKEAGPKAEDKKADQAKQDSKQQDAKQDAKPAAGKDDAKPAPAAAKSEDSKPAPAAAKSDDAKPAPAAAKSEDAKPAPAAAKAEDSKPAPAAKAENGAKPAAAASDDAKPAPAAKSDAPKPEPPADKSGDAKPAPAATKDDTKPAPAEAKQDSKPASKNDAKQDAAKGDQAKKGDEAKKPEAAADSKSQGGGSKGQDGSKPGVPAPVTTANAKPSQASDQKGQADGNKAAPSQQQQPVVAAAVSKPKDAPGPSSSQLAKELADNLSASQPGSEVGTAISGGARGFNPFRVLADAGLLAALAGSLVAGAALLPGPREAILSRLQGRSPAQRAAELRERLEAQRAAAAAAQRELERSQAELADTQQTLDALNGLLQRNRRGRGRDRL